MDSQWELIALAGVAPLLLVLIVTWFAGRSWAAELRRFENGRH